MKKLKDILLFGILLLCLVPKLVSADVLRLDYYFEKTAKLGDEISYYFSINTDYAYDYSFSIIYDKEYLELVSNTPCVGLSAVDRCPTIVSLDTEKINVEHSNGVNRPISLTFKTLKEGNTKLEVLPSENTNFGENGGPQEINIETEIINTNVVSPECETGGESDTSQTEKVLYIFAGSFLTLVIGILIFIIVNLKKKNVKQ